MVISLEKIVRDFGLKIRGVLHIGAHTGEEYPAYVRQGVQKMIFFEPIKSNFEELRRRIPDIEGIETYNVALGSEETDMEMFVETENGGQSCSLLEPALHLIQYPNIEFPAKEMVHVVKLDDVPFFRPDYNMINIDTQGYELQVFKGAEKTLKFIDIIYSEVNRDEVYKDCARVEEIDHFLLRWNFHRVLTDWIGKSWGDAVYLKNYDFVSDHNI